jgi:DNA-binding Lrp family transcriptional regulator
MNLDEIDKSILALAEGDLDVCERPFDAWAGKIGIPVEEVIFRLQALKERGVIRVIKAVLRHTQAGFTANAMVAWSVPKAHVDEIGQRIASFPAVSHCYERKGFGAFNIFSMIHARTDDKIMEIVNAISHATGINDYQIFRSIKELKKTSMRYFGQEGSCDE